MSRILTSKLWFIMRVITVTAVGFFGIHYLINPGMYEVQLTPYADVIHQVMIMIHASTGGLALLIGVWQFNDRWRAQHRSLFRKLGIAYTWAVLISALTGFYVAFFAQKAEFSGKVGFLLLSIFWLYTLWMGYRSIKQKNIKERREWFIRNYALTLAAVTLRLYLGLFIGGVFALDGLGVIDVAVADRAAFDANYFDWFYPVLAWISWVPNILIAEYGLIVPKNSKIFKTRIHN